MNFYMLRAILCGGVMVGLAAASLVLESQLNVPLVNEYGVLCFASPDRLMWWDHRRVTQRKPDKSVYDLETNRLDMRSSRQSPWIEKGLPDGRHVRLEPRGTSATLCIMDPEMMETIRETTLPLLFRPELLNQRYLVTERAGTMFVCDVLAEDPSQLLTMQLTDWHPLANSLLYLVSGTDLVVEIAASPSATRTSMPNPPNAATQTTNVHIYQIDEQSIRQVASWKSALFGSGMARHGDILLSLSTDGLAIEGRDLRSFELVSREPLPKAIVDCMPGVQFKGDLCEVNDPRSKQRTIYRLDTLKELENARELNIVDTGTLALDRSDLPYRLLYSQSSANQFRLAVYDMKLNKLIWDQNYDGYDAKLLDGDRLVVVTSQYGIAADIIDLKTSRILKTVRPYAWLLPLYVLWAIAAASVAFGWVYYSARAGLSLLASISMIALIVPIEVYPLTLHGTAMNVGRLATSYSLAILLSASAAVIWIAFSQLQNRIMRSTYQLAVITVIAVVVAALDGCEVFPQKWMVPSALFIAITTAIASFMGLMILRVLGHRIRWSSDRYAQSNSTLWQFFVLTTASAGMLVACMPFQTIAWQFPKNWGPLAALAVAVAIPYLFVFLLLKLSDRWFQRWTYIAAAVAALLIVDFIAAFIRPHLFTMNIAAAVARICLAGFVITFLWLWAFRLRGCSIARLGNS